MAGAQAAEAALLTAVALPDTMQLRPAPSPVAEVIRAQQQRLVVAEQRHHLAARALRLLLEPHH
jgi:hypothetical protein